MDTEQIIRLSIHSKEASKLKSLEARMIGPSKNGVQPMISVKEDFQLSSIRPYMSKEIF